MPGTQVVHPFWMIYGRAIYIGHVLSIDDEDWTIRGVDLVVP